MRKRFLAVLLALSVFALLFTPAFAIGDPDYITIGDAYAFRNILESGDILMFLRYDVSYSTVPDEDAESTYIMAIYDTDGTTLLHTRPLNYYEHNVISIYLSADNNDLTWGSEYYLRVMGNPAVFPVLTEGTNMRTRTLSGGDYAATEDFGGVLISQAAILEDDWPGVTLLTASDLLNVTGAKYFNDAIPGLTQMLPDIFSEQTLTFPFTRSTYNNTGINRTIDNLPTSLNSAIRGMDDIFGITNHNWGGFAWTLLAGLIVGGIIYGTVGRPDVTLLGGVLTVFSLSAYMGVSNGNMMLFVLTIAIGIVVLFAAEFIIPRFS